MLLILVVVVALPGCSTDDPSSPPPPPPESLTISYTGSELWSEVSAMTVSGNLLFNGMQYGLQVADISTPETPTQVAQIFIPYGVEILVVDGQYAYALGNEQLKVIRIVPTNEVQVVSSLDIPGFAGSLAAGNGAVYVVTYLGMSVVSVIEPEAPVVVSEMAQYGIRSAFLDGDDLYLSTNAGMKIFDVSDPAEPVQTSVFEFAGAGPITVTDGRCFVRSTGSCMTGPFGQTPGTWERINLFDVSDPQVPVWIDHQESPCAWFYRGPNLFSRGTELFAYAGDLRIWRVVDPGELVLTGTYESGLPTRNAKSHFAVSGDYAYLPGAQILSVADLTSPVLISEGLVPKGLHAIVLANGMAYVLGENNLFAVDVSAPASSMRRGHLARTGLVDVAVQGNNAYLAGENLEVIDITNPDLMVSQGTYGTPGLVRSIAVVGNWAYVAAGNDGLHIVDVSNGASPELAVAMDELGFVENVVVVGDYAYVGTSTNFSIVDVTNPGQPVVVGVINEFGGEVTVRDGLAYLATNGALKIYDIANLAAPVILGTYRDVYNPTGISVEGDHVYVAVSCSNCDDVGVKAINISDPSAPFLDGHYASPGSAEDIAVDGDYLYVADGTGVLVLRVEGE